MVHGDLGYASSDLVAACDASLAGAEAFGRLRVGWLAGWGTVIGDGRWKRRGTRTATDPAEHTEHVVAPAAPSVDLPMAQSEQELSEEWAVRTAVASDKWVPAGHSVQLALPFAAVYFPGPAGRGSGE